MFRSDKSRMVGALTYSDLSGGLNVAVDRASVKPNELTQANNVTYDAATGMLMTRKGLFEWKSLSYSAVAFEYAAVLGGFLVSSSDHKLYLETQLTSTLLGTLTGTEIPTFAPWEEGYIVASGGALQKTDGTTLTSLGSPNGDIAFTREARVWVAAVGGDTLTASGIEDETNWTVDTNDMNAKDVDISAKDGLGIMAVVPASDNLLIFKGDGGDKSQAFMLSGLYPNWTVTPLATKVFCSGKRAAQSVGSIVYAMGIDGFRRLEPTDLSVPYQMMELDDNIRPLISDGISSGWIAYLPQSRHGWFVPDGGKQAYVLHGNGKWTTFSFPIQPLGATTDGVDEYVLAVDGIYKLDNCGTDGDDPFYWTIGFGTQAYIDPKVVKRIASQIVPLTAGNATLDVNGMTISVSYGAKHQRLVEDTDLVYYDTDLIGETTERKVLREVKRTNMRCSAIASALTGTGRIFFRAVEIKTAG